VTQPGQLLYASKRLPRSLWQKYQIYTDRIVLGFCFGQKTLPVGDIVDVQVRPPIVIADLLRGKGFLYSLALKLDLADFFRHVAIHRRTGWVKHLRITPDDPDRFVAVCKSLMERKGLEYDGRVPD
jgi:hypothetical protein